MLKIRKSKDSLSRGLISLLSVLNLFMFVILGPTFGVIFFTFLNLLYIMKYVLDYWIKRCDSKVLRLIRSVYLSLIIIFALSFIIVESLIISNMHSQVDATEHDIIVVLGAGLNGDQVTNRLKSRLDKALELIDNNPELEVLVSGGQGPDEKVTEAHAMKSYLINEGVDPTHILVEELSTSTYENLLFSKEILDAKLIDKSIIIVTSDYHTYRASYISKKIGLDVVTAPSHSPAMIRVNYMLREYFVVIKDWLKLSLIA
ncbi:YdcF family protein [Vallitalea okinawensis]|uniref:YdcF family protein n=1 Tax=Vallitalea okinawensis TaxID=2078660 RepID=UPI0014784E48|nr:YdcF family protein [Vallitalea okinawensis]